MAKQPVLSQMSSKARAAVESIVAMFDTGWHRSHMDEQLPPNVERHGKHLLVRVTNPTERHPGQRRY